MKFKVRIYYTVPAIGKIVSAWIRTEYMPDDIAHATEFPSYSDAAKHVDWLGMDNIREIRIYAVK